MFPSRLVRLLPFKNNRTTLTMLLLLAYFQVDAQVVISPSDDCYIYASGPKAAEPYGMIDPDSLKTRKSVSSDQFTRETYIKFLLGSRDTTYILAQVKIYGQVLESKKVQIYFTDTTWLEETLIGNTRPPGTYIGDLQLEAGEKYYAWNVTNYINQAVSQGRKSVAFILKDVAGGVSTIDTKWHSKENASGKLPLLELTEGQPAVHRTGAYYIDFISGNDDNTAASPSKPWKTLEKVCISAFEPGDSILLKSGVTWQGQLRFSGSGAAGKPILVGKYGSGSNPVIDGNGQFENTVQLTNQQYIEIQDLHITNWGDTVAFRRGVFIQAEDMGIVRHIILRRLELSDINGSMDTEISKNNGGVFFDITGSGTPTYFDTLVVEDCYIHDVDRTGISNRSSWSTRTSTSDGNWTPSRNMIFRNNTFERTGANALIVRVAYKPLMEYNLFNNCAIKGSGNASFSFNTNYALWQYNEACLTKYNSGDDDAGGFDSDYNSKYTTIQYNYSHDNGYGAILLTGGPGSNFNDGTVIRYNVMANNNDHVIRTSGSANNSMIYNNTIYCKPSLANIHLIWHKSWEGYSSNTKYYNNIFQVMGTGATIDLGTSTGNVFDYNIFYGPNLINLPNDPHILTVDPQFISPDRTYNTYDSLTGFRLKETSPAINSGMIVPGAPKIDFEGTAVPTYGVADRGAFEYQGPNAVEFAPWSNSFKVYPNPAKEYITIEVADFDFHKASISLYDTENKICYQEEFNTDGTSLKILLNLKKNQLVPGIYYLKVSCGGHSSCKSVTILR